MPNNLFNRFGNANSNINNQNYSSGNSLPYNNIIAQFMQLNNNPGLILDIMLRNGKINQQQYNELQPYKNNPEMIGQYLMNNGKINEINNATQLAKQKMNN